MFYDDSWRVRDRHLCPSHVRHLVRDLYTQQFEADLCFYYQELKNFIDEAKNFAGFPKSLFLQLLPFANNMKMWLHGSIKETSYITNLRVRPGGHINYRHLAYLISQKATDKDPLLQSLNLSQDRLPNPNSKQEFFDRRQPIKSWTFFWSTSLCHTAHTYVLCFPLTFFLSFLGT